mmetsp:Transcript_11946/g.18059  ORF Transcript_11946/g.18059 Transcript_11946/m.18059 type:complete len:334 (+) Transcript_11946:108-1109(+)
MTSSETSHMGENWIRWFCGLPGNHVFAEVDKSFIEDAFNIFGLKQYVLNDYSIAMCLILDKKTPPLDPYAELGYNKSAALLYGMIHARYICTLRGLEAMKRKYLEGYFGTCPRLLCHGQKVIPMGMTDLPHLDCMKLYCPSCQDVYSCLQSQSHIDAACFGPTFPHMFFMTFENLVPEGSREVYVPKVYGFKVHSSSPSLARGCTARATNIPQQTSHPNSSRVTIDMSSSIFHPPSGVQAQGGRTNGGAQGSVSQSDTGGSSSRTRRGVKRDRSGQDNAQAKDSKLSTGETEQGTGEEVTNLADSEPDAKRINNTTEQTNSSHQDGNISSKCG